MNISSGRFVLSEVTGTEALTSELERIKPAELLVPEDLTEITNEIIKCTIRRRPIWEFENHNARSTLCEHFQIKDLSIFSCDGFTAGIEAAGCLLQYAKETQKADLPHIQGIKVELASESVILDAATRKNLEIDFNFSGGRENTLISIVDSTLTPMGKRLLSRWLNRPLKDREKLEIRQNIVSSLIDNFQFEQIGELLAGFGDLERILARLGLRSARPRDLTTIRESLAILPNLQRLLKDIDSPEISLLANRISEFPAQVDLSLIHI